MGDIVRIGVSTAVGSGKNLLTKASELSQRLGLGFVTDGGEEYSHLLVIDDEKLSLCPVGRRSKVGGGVYVELLTVNTNAGPGGSLRQPIAKAVGIGRARKLAVDEESKVLHVVDATAGLGEDSWLLASLGCRVTAIERNAVVAELLRDGLRRAGKVNGLVADRITIVEGDSRVWLNERSVDAKKIDVVYVDPMFPAKGKSALQRKEMRVLRDVVGLDLDADELLTAARRVAKQRVVVKRPVHGDAMSGEILATHKGKSMRYDVYGIIK